MLLPAACNRAANVPASQHPGPSVPQLMLVGSCVRRLGVQDMQGTFCRMWTTAGGQALVISACGNDTTGQAGVFL